MLKSHQALQRRVELGNGAPGLADQHITRSLHTGSLLPRTLVDTRLRARLRGARGSGSYGRIHAAQKSTGLGSQ